MNKLKGFRNIPSIMKRMQSERLSTQSQYSEYETFNELAKLGREKIRLWKEKKNWQERVERIDARLKEIEELERSLHRQVAMIEKTDLDTLEAIQTVGKKGREVVIKY